MLRVHADSSNTEVLNANSSNVCTVEQVEDVRITGVSDPRGGGGE